MSAVRYLRHQTYFELVEGALTIPAFDLGSKSATAFDGVPATDVDDGRQAVPEPTVAEPTRRFGVGLPELESRRREPMRGAFLTLPTITQCTVTRVTLAARPQGEALLASERFMGRTLSRSPATPFSPLDPNGPGVYFQLYLGRVPWRDRGTFGVLPSTDHWRGFDDAGNFVEAEDIIPLHDPIYNNRQLQELFTTNTERDSPFSGYGGNWDLEIGPIVLREDWRIMYDITWPYADAALVDGGDAGVRVDPAPFAVSVAMDRLG